MTIRLIGIICLTEIILGFWALHALRAILE